MLRFFTFITILLQIYYFPLIMTGKQQYMSKILFIDSILSKYYFVAP